MEKTIETIWSRSKLLVKCAIIAVLVLFLLIPTFQVQNLIEEREARARDAVTEVSSKWAGNQTITGPVIAVPFTASYGNSARNTRAEKQWLYLLPDSLDVKAQVTPQERSRGIYKVMLYSAQLSFTGAFNQLQFDKLKIAPDAVRWNEAQIQVRLSDAHGLNDELKLIWNGVPLQLTPESSQDSELVLSAPLPVDGYGGLKKLAFSAQFHLNGSQQLLLTPVGKTTTVAMSAPWQHPSFTGSFLPQTWEVTNGSFTAQWRSLSHNRTFAQAFVGNTAILKNAAFGVDFFIPVNGYQKTLRSVKYAVLCIVLTFVAFFLIETVHKRSVHPLQYALIGLALVLFYMLLLSLSEYIGFNLAYAVAAIATIALIGWFVKGVLASGRLSGYLSMLLLLVYVYIFTILQLQDYALLLGSIGLFISLAFVMYFAKKWSW